MAQAIEVGQPNMQHAVQDPKTLAASERASVQFTIPQYTNKPMHCALRQVMAINVSQAFRHMNETGAAKIGLGTVHTVWSMAFFLTM